MLFLVDTKNKIIFGYSAKCGCSHIKNIYWFLQKNNIIDNIHKSLYCHNLPNDIENYTTLIFCRNPYQRLLSGFLDKYKKDGQYRNRWRHPSLSFSQFVDELVKSNWSIIDQHHFTPQTTEKFDKKIHSSKIIKIYDICNIDYQYIEKLYNKKIPDNVLNKKQGHERSFHIKYKYESDKNVYDLHIDEYQEYDVDIKFFYNEDIKEKVFKFYINDFNFFKNNDIDYTI